MIEIVMAFVHMNQESMFYFLRGSHPIEFYGRLKFEDSLQCRHGVLKNIFVSKVLCCNIINLCLFSLSLSYTQLEGNKCYWKINFRDKRGKIVFSLLILAMVEILLSQKASF